MALKAGRVGVNPDAVDNRGNVKNTGSSYELPIATPTVLGGVKPVAKTSDMTQDVGIDDSGKLYAAGGGGGIDAIYYKDFAGNVSDKFFVSNSSVSINGYTPISATLLSQSSGYKGFAGLERNYDGTGVIHAIGYVSVSASGMSARVYYVKNEHIQSLT